MVSNEKYNSLSSVLTSTPSNIILSTSLVRICQGSPIRYAELWVHQNTSQYLELIGIWNDTQAELFGFQKLNATQSIEQFGSLQGKVWHSLETEWIPDLVRETFFTDSWKKAASLAGLISGLGLPILIGHRLQAIGVFYLTKAVESEVALIKLLGKTASRLGIEVSKAIAKTPYALSPSILENNRDDSDLVEYMAYYDVLTDLPNRLLFQTSLTQALDLAKDNQKNLSVLFIDVDRFKTINDSLGHNLGDILLQEFAQRLSSCIRKKEDILARWGGDEFIVLVQSVDEPEEIAQLARRIIDAFQSPIKCLGYNLHVSCSIGIALFPENGADAQTLMKNADSALYRAKELGRNTYAFYTSTLNERAIDRLLLENELRQALVRNELELYYQPILHTLSRRIVGNEALLRWNHPKQGLLLPDRFIPIAEETGIAVQLTEWILREACAQTRAWQLTGFADLTIAVNLSAREFRNPLLLEQVARVLQDTELPARSLKLEITESTAMQNVNQSIEVINGLRDMGVQIAIDDFGTGYSSIAYLKQFACDTLKIDRSFIQEASALTSDGHISKCMVDLGHSLSMTVVAEGVETESQLHFLETIQCESVQGYLFSRPIPAGQMSEYLVRHSKSDANQYMKGTGKPIAKP